MIRMLFPNLWQQDKSPIRALEAAARCSRASAVAPVRGAANIPDGCRDGLDTSRCDVRTCSGPSAMRARPACRTVAGFRRVHGGGEMTACRVFIHGWHSTRASGRRALTNNARIDSVDRSLGPLADRS